MVVKLSILAILAVSCVLGTLGEETADLQKGIELYQARKFDEAVVRLKRAVESDPADVAARYHLGLALVELKQYTEAESQFKQAGELRAEIGPRKDQILAGFAQAYMGQGRLDEAERTIREALEARDDSTEAHLALGKLYLHRKKYAEAAKALDKAIELNPKDPYAHYYAGIAYSNIGRQDRMVNEFQMFLKLAPDAPEAAKVRSLLRSVR